MTTTEGFGPMLVARGYRKMMSGMWESPGHDFRVYSYGVNPQEDWKVFRRVGQQYIAVPGWSGSGSDSLARFLNEHTA